MKAILEDNKCSQQRKYFYQTPRSLHFPNRFMVMDFIIVRIIILLIGIIDWKYFLNIFISKKYFCHSNLFDFFFFWVGKIKNFFFKKEIGEEKSQTTWAKWNYPYPHKKFIFFSNMIEPINVHTPVKFSGDFTSMSWGIMS